MKKSAILLNSEVIVKVPFKGTADQIHGTITAMDSNFITVTEIVEEGVTPRKVTIPAASAEVMAFVKNPSVPDADIVDGELIVNGETIRTGFVPEAVLATLANRVYITVASEENSERKDIYSYNVAKDEFYKVTKTPLALNIKGKKEIGTSLIIPFLNKHQEEEIVTENDQKVKKTYNVLESTGYLLISTEASNGGFANIIETELGTDPILNAVTMDGDRAAIFTTVSKQTTNNSAVDTCEEYDYDEDDYSEGDAPDEEVQYRSCGRSYGRIVDLPDDKIIVRMYKATGRHLSEIAAVEMIGEFKSAVTAGKTTVVKTDKEIRIAANGRTYDIDKASAIKALDGFNYVVKTEKVNGELKIWFANNDLEIKVYSVSPAQDARGPIIEVK